ncbi:GNAT family N-acetyltransferase [Hymenobacter sp. BT175]|uniref:GNAT family N-acetyltransferase n=1 Tax=Hymenobacter translucens TaxID=2886507 RepID=UPI001D0E2EFC|nr:GNAT family N-acetyltransferase [Hymenobacter translucens]MCC2546192.1 GNAT family N-acetyltransferase [Hymenobacter translucens]
MPLRYLRYSELNLAAWDACVASAREAVPYAHSWWLHAVAGRWDAVVETGPQGQYVALLPLPYKRRPWGREAYQPAFTQQLGLLSTASSRHELPEFLTLAAGHFPRFYQQLNTGNALPAPPPGFTLNERQTYLLDLSPAYETLLAGYAADYRRRLRQLQQRAELQVVGTNSLKEAARLFKAERGRAAGLHKGHYRQLEYLYGALRPRHEVQIWEVEQPQTGELLASALFVRHPRRLIYLFAAASAAGKQAGAPLLLLDHEIRLHAGTPGLVLDFEGSMIPSIARFFANFGATPASYAAVSFHHKPWYLQWLS